MGFPFGIYSPHPSAIALVVPPEHPFIGPEILNGQAMLSVWAHGNKGADLQVLMFGKDNFRTWPGEIVQKIVAVPAGPVHTHLDDPRVNAFSGRMDRYCPSSIEGRIAHNIIPWHRASDLIVGCPPAKLPGTESGKIEKHKCN